MKGSEKNENITRNSLDISKKIFNVADCYCQIILFEIVFEFVKGRTRRVLLWKDTVISRLNWPYLIHIKNFGVCVTIGKTSEFLVCERRKRSLNA